LTDLNNSQSVEPDAIQAAIAAIRGEMSVALGRVDRVRDACRSLQTCDLPSPCVVELARLTGRRNTALATEVFECVADQCRRMSDPWPVIRELLLVRNDPVVRYALALLADLADAGRVRPCLEILQTLAESIEHREGLRNQPAVLRLAARILRADSGRDAPRRVFISHACWRVRRLAARVLDAEQQPAPVDVAQKVLSTEAFEFLADYLTYTRATHLDLLDIAPTAGGPPPGLASWRQAERVCGATLLREIIGRIGWARLNFGLDVRRLHGVSLDGAFPVLAQPLEAQLLDDCPYAARTFDRFLIIAHGGMPQEAGESSESGDAISRFRSYNLAHAEALGEIADVAPLTAAKVRSILELIERICADFTALFREHDAEAVELPARFQHWKAQTLDKLARTVDGEPLPPELTRFVQMFEEPASLADVHTLHGLKRYLHQKGLRLAFKLFESGKATNRTVDLLTASPERVLHWVAPIQYIDFDPEPGNNAIPYAVELAARAFGQQLIHGREGIPKVDIFCYGNEVHYYLRYRNHPAFLRIDYAPPLRGGMIDLEYFGVSKFELSMHPNVELAALKRFFRALDFDVQIEDTRVHARYDKERTLDLGDLCDRAEALFCLAPYLMELDWIVGYLTLSEEAKRKVTAAWAEHFVRWRALPLDQLLTADRQGIPLVEQASGEEHAWSGRGAYRDRFTRKAPAGLLDDLREALAARKLDCIVLPAGADDSIFGQAPLDQRLLRPLREAVARGEIVETPTGLAPRPSELFQREHEAEQFARFLTASDGILRDLARMAGVATALERSLRFQTTGTVNGYDVQRAQLALRNDVIDLFVLRDGGGMIRLAFYATGRCLYKIRESEEEPWRGSWSPNTSTLATMLRKCNYMAAGIETTLSAGPYYVAPIRAVFATPNPRRGAPPIAGDRVVHGVAASPGRAVGRAALAHEGRPVTDFDGAVMIAATVRPEDNTAIWRAAGIVSTGGGVLSHAGLLAVQFGKPAMIIPADWRVASNGRRCLVYQTTEFDETVRTVGPYRVTMRQNVRQREDVIAEGDLVVLDADHGQLRVLGKDHEVLAFHDELRNIAQVTRRLQETIDDGETLVLRGRRLHARHQLEKLLTRMRSPVLARHAVRELLWGATFNGGQEVGDERGRLLDMLLGNADVGEAARGCVLEIHQDLEERFRLARGKIGQRLPAARNPYEVLAHRLELLRLRDTLASLPRPIGIEAPSGLKMEDVDALAVERLKALRKQAKEDLASQRDDARSRHTLQQIERIDGILGNDFDDAQTLRRRKTDLDARDAERLRRGRSQRILTVADGGFELHALIGWKAANLAEIDRLGAADMVPDWFVVTDRAFREVLATPVADNRVDGLTLGDAIEHVLHQDGMDNLEKSNRIARLWEQTALPAELVNEITKAYRALGSPDPVQIQIPGGKRFEAPGHEPFVAVRSSAREEDSETATRAGEFETFLFVRSIAGLLDHLRRAWSGLWTERAIHNRHLLGLEVTDTGGGVLVQRICWSRVAGVLQTVNLADGRLGEIVVNAGLGLGAGVVSGLVGTDQITVARDETDENAPLRFRYVTSDKHEQMVFNARAGTGTVLTETLYHQRLRPALEYVELEEIVRTALRLEEAYGYPLDIEFGIEAANVRLLQVRPVANYSAVLRQSLERYPLHARQTGPETCR
jgi:phosphohistidine swiveling domain-containing protein